MSRVSFTRIQPGDVASAASLNTPFGAIATASTTINQQNLRTDAIDSQNISKPAVFSNSIQDANTSSTPGTYVGNTWQAVTHGSTALDISGINLVAGDVLVINWKQTIAEMRANTASISYRCKLRLTWNLGDGAGWVQVPGSPIWECNGYNNLSGVVTNQNTWVNAGGSVIYKAAASITADLRLYVLPGANALDEVDLQEGVLAYIRVRR